MATVQKVILVCDQCGQDENQVDGIETIRVEIDGHAVEGELCSGDRGRLLEAFAAFATSGRPVPRTTKLRQVKPWPGSTWRFTSHALIRCGERNLDPLEIVAVLDDPAVTRPGKASDQEIRERNGVKVVCVPDRGIVVTVARKGEDATDAHVDGHVG